MDETQFTVDEARALLPELLRHTDELVTLRADLAELNHELAEQGSSPRGGPAEVKGLQARLSELTELITGRGIELKGLAPVLLDFPAVLDGHSVRLCWIEGERELRWYHRSELGFAGRRPLP